MKITSKSILIRQALFAILMSILLLSMNLYNRAMADDDERHTINVGNIGLIVTNYGTVGLAFAERGRHSCEYPIGSHKEHMFLGGLWVGGIQNNQIRVSTGAIDISSLQYRNEGGFEYTTGQWLGTPTSNPADTIIEKSLLPISPYYDPDAVSHQDFICNYTDSNTVVPQLGEEIPGHTPLGLVVHQEIYAWSQSFADAFVILSFVVKNASQFPITDLYIGYWIDTMVGNTDLNPPPNWAPTYTWRWYDDANNYVDSMQMCYEYDYDGDFGYAENYVGMRVLGTEPALVPGTDSTYLDKVQFYEWIFRDTQDPVFFAPQNDIQRYERMTTGLNNYPTWRTFPSAIGPLNRSMLISTGPFEQINPGDSVMFTFAITCAEKYGSAPMQDDLEISRKNLYLNSLWAKRTYNGEDKNGNGILDPGEDLWPYNGVLDRYRLPEPPPPPSVKLIPGESKVDVYWDDGPEHFIDPVTGSEDFEGYKIYRARLTNENQGVGLKQLFELIGQYDIIDSIGYNTGLDFVRLPEPIDIDGHTYHYKFTNDDLLNGWQYAFAVSSFDMGDPDNNLESLESNVLLSYGRVFTGPVAGVDERMVTVFPNPYKATSLWDGRGDDGVQERSRLLYFANLPARCRISIYTLAGDLVDVLEHDAATYNGQDINWFNEYAAGEKIFSGGIHGWDLVTKSDQAVATGLYFYTVEDEANGKIYKGKFVVIK